MSKLHYTLLAAFIGFNLLLLALLLLRILTAYARALWPRAGKAAPDTQRLSPDMQRLSNAIALAQPRAWTRPIRREKQAANETRRQATPMRALHSG